MHVRIRKEEAERLQRYVDAVNVDLKNFGQDEITPSDIVNRLLELGISRLAFDPIRGILLR